MFEVEFGCFFVVEVGVLFVEVWVIKIQDDFDYVVVDVGFDCLICFVMYGVYYYVSVVGVLNGECLQVVVGLFCELVDMFMQVKGGVVDL